MNNMLTSKDKAMASVDFSFEGLLIERIIAHRVFPKSADKSLPPPKNQQVFNGIQTRCIRCFSGENY